METSISISHVFIRSWRGWTGEMAQWIKAFLAQASWPEFKVQHPGWERETNSWCPLCPYCSIFAHPNTHTIYTHTVYTHNKLNKIFTQPFLIIQALSKIIDLKRKRFILAQFQKFDLISTGPVAFAPVVSAVHHDGSKYWGEATAYGSQEIKGKEIPESSISPESIPSIPSLPSISLYHLLISETHGLCRVEFSWLSSQVSHRRM